jgi:hypothetical protein
VAGAQLTVTDVMVGGVEVTVTVAVPDLVASCALVAVTATAAVAAGAVSRPLVETDPALADHVTAEL